MLSVGVVAGIAIWGALNTGMEWTNRTEFCTSCHEMTIPLEELKKTIVVLDFDTRARTRDLVLQVIGE